MNNGVHVGYAAACGSGVEPGCEIHTGAIKTACQNDVRTGFMIDLTISEKKEKTKIPGNRKAWRGAVTRIDRAGNLVWYRLDSWFWSANERGESASEYIFQDANDRIVSVTDEGFGGFGFLTYDSS